MIATIRYTDCMQDRRIVFSILSQLNVHIIRSQSLSWGIQYKIKLVIENVDKLNEILAILNKNTIYGVELLYYRPTFREILSELKGLLKK